MSLVTNVVLLAGACVLVDDDYEPTAAFAFVQEQLEREHHQRFIVTPSSMVGGSKELEGEVAMAAFNHVAPDVVLRILRAAPWEAADVVQVAIMAQEDYAWTLHHVFGEVSA